MTDGLKSQEEQAIRKQADEVHGRLEGLAVELASVDGELESLAPKRTQHQLLDQACGALEKLDELGAASVFWGESVEPDRAAAQLRNVRSMVSAFETEVGELDGRRQQILDRIAHEEENLEILGEDLFQIREAEERRKLEWLVERDISPVPRRAQLMAWARGGDDDRRFRRTLAASLLASLLFALLFPMVNLPMPRPLTNDDALPRRLAQFLRQEQAIPAPPQPLVAGEQEQLDTPDPEEPDPVDPPEPSEAQPPPETQIADVTQPEPAAGAPGPLGPEPPVGAPPGPPERPAAPAGILAFSEQFASLSEDRVAPRLGADARFGDADDVSAASSASRSLLTSNTPGSSGGIDISSLSRNVRGGGGGGGGGGGAGGNGSGGGGMVGVEVGRATSTIASIAGGDRPMASGGPGLSRTDEEIQIVFDRHKAEFYRFYNRELRNNPALQGQMVLRLTIEPDGSVSMCALQSTDMDAPGLADQVVNRVRTIDFGAKDVEAMTIAYPIDFLPASL